MEWVDRRKPDREAKERRENVVSQTGLWLLAERRVRAENEKGEIDWVRSSPTLPQTANYSTSMYFSSRPFCDSEAADHLPSTSLVRVHRALYGGKGSDSHISSLPSQDDIKQTVDACYELDSGEWMDYHALTAHIYIEEKDREASERTEGSEGELFQNVHELAPPSLSPCLLPPPLLLELIRLHSDIY